MLHCNERALHWKWFCLDVSPIFCWWPCDGRFVASNLRFVLVPVCHSKWPFRLLTNGTSNTQTKNRSSVIHRNYYEWSVEGDVCARHNRISYRFLCNCKEHIESETACWSIHSIGTCNWYRSLKKRIKCKQNDLFQANGYDRLRCGSIECECTDSIIDVISYINKRYKKIAAQTSTVQFSTNSSWIIPGPI